MRNDWVGFWAGVAGVGTTLLGLAFATFQLRPDPVALLMGIFRRRHVDALVDNTRREVWSAASCRRDGVVARFWVS